MSDKSQYNDINAMISKYIDLATTHGEATECGDSNSANAAIVELDTVFNQLVNANARIRIIELLNNTNLSVLAHAAFHTYSLDPQRSIEVLGAISQQKGLVGFSAGMTLTQLQSGAISAP